MLAAWGRRSAAMDEHAHSPISAASLLLSFRVRFDPTAAADLAVRMALQVDAYLYLLEISGGSLWVERTSDAVAGASPVVTTDSTTLAAALQGASLDALAESGRLQVTGDLQVLAHVVAALG